MGAARLLTALFAVGAVNALLDSSGLCACQSACMPINATDGTCMTSRGAPASCSAASPSSPCKIPAFTLDFNTTVAALLPRDAPVSLAFWKTAAVDFAVSLAIVELDTKSNPMLTSLVTVLPWVNATADLTVNIPANLPWPKGSGRFAFAAVPSPTDPAMVSVAPARTSRTFNVTYPSYSVAVLNPPSPVMAMADQPTAFNVTLRIAGPFTGSSRFRLVAIDSATFAPMFNLTSGDPMVWFPAMNGTAMTGFTASRGGMYDVYAMGASAELDGWLAFTGLRLNVTAPPSMQPSLTLASPMDSAIIYTGNQMNIVVNSQYLDYNASSATNSMLSATLTDGVGMVLMTLIPSMAVTSPSMSIPYTLPAMLPNTTGATVSVSIISGVGQGLMAAARNIAIYNMASVQITAPMGGSTLSVGSNFTFSYSTQFMVNSYVFITLMDTTLMFTYDTLESMLLITPANATGSRTVYIRPSAPTGPFMLVLSDSRFAQGGLYHAIPVTIVDPNAPTITPVSPASGSSVVTTVGAATQTLRVTINTRNLMYATSGAASYLFASISPRTDGSAIPVYSGYISAPGTLTFNATLPAYFTPGAYTLNLADLTTRAYGSILLNAVPAVTPSFNLTAPMPMSVVHDNVTFRWNSVGLDASAGSSMNTMIRFALSTFDGTMPSTWIPLRSMPLRAASGSWNWTVPVGFPSGTYQIMANVIQGVGSQITTNMERMVNGVYINNTANMGATTMMNAPFISFSSPPPGSSVQSNSMVMIGWMASNIDCTQNATIFLEGAPGYLGTWNMTIARNVPICGGSYNWATPAFTSYMPNIIVNIVVEGARFSGIAAVLNSVTLTPAGGTGGGKGPGPSLMLSFPPSVMTNGVVPGTTVVAMYNGMGLSCGMDVVVVRMSSPYGDSPVSDYGTVWCDANGTAMGNLSIPVPMNAMPGPVNLTVAVVAGVSSGVISNMVTVNVQAAAMPMLVPTYSGAPLTVGQPFNFTWNASNVQMGDMAVLNLTSASNMTASITLAMAPARAGWVTATIPGTVMPGLFSLVLSIAGAPMGWSVGPVAVNAPGGTGGNGTGGMGGGNGTAARLWIVAPTTLTPGRNFSVSYWGTGLTCSQDMLQFFTVEPATMVESPMSAPQGPCNASGSISGWFNLMVPPTAMPVAVWLRVRVVSGPAMNTMAQAAANVTGMPMINVTSTTLPASMVRGMSSLYHIFYTTVGMQASDTLVFNLTSINTTATWWLTTVGASTGMTSFSIPAAVPSGDYRVVITAPMFPWTSFPGARVMIPFRVNDPINNGTVGRASIMLTNADPTIAPGGSSVLAYSGGNLSCASDMLQLAIVYPTSRVSGSPFKACTVDGPFSSMIQVGIPSNTALGPISYVLSVVSGPNTGLSSTATATVVNPSVMYMVRPFSAPAGSMIPLNFTVRPRAVPRDMMVAINITNPNMPGFMASVMPVPAFAGAIMLTIPFDAPVMGNYSLMLFSPSHPMTMVDVLSGNEVLAPSDFPPPQPPVDKPMGAFTMASVSGGVLLLGSTSNAVSFGAVNMSCSTDMVIVSFMTLQISDAVPVCQTSGLQAGRIPIRLPDWTTPGVVTMQLIVVGSGPNAYTTMSFNATVAAPSISITSAAPVQQGGLATVSWTAMYLGASDMVHVNISSPNIPDVPMVTVGVFAASLGRGSFQVPFDATIGEYTIVVGVAGRPNIQSSSRIVVAEAPTIANVMVFDAAVGPRMNFTSAKQGSQVAVNWALRGVAPGIKQTVWLCNTQMVFNGSNCLAVGAFFTPVNSTAFVVPFIAPVSTLDADYTVKVSAFLGRDTVSASNSFMVQTGDAAAAQVRVTAPIAPVTVAVGAGLNVSWTVTGLSSTSMVTLDAILPGASMAYNNLTWNVPVAANGGCMLPTCMGMWRWDRVPAGFVVPTTAATPVPLLMCVRPAGTATTRRVCSAPVYVVAQAVPTLRAGLAWAGANGTLFSNTAATLPAIRIGSALTVRWIATDLPGDVSVTLMSSSADFAPVALPSTAVATGSAAFQVADALASTTTLYFFRVASLGANTADVYADTPMFSIVPMAGTLSVTGPVAGSSFTVGGAAIFSWTASGVTGDVALEIITVDTKTVVTTVRLPTVAASAGQYILSTVPAEVLRAGSASVSVMLRVRSVANGAVAAMSGAFTFNAPAYAFSSLAIIPFTNAGAIAANTFAMGSSVVATWSSTGFPATATATVTLMAVTVNNTWSWAASRTVLVSSGMLSFTMPQLPLTAVQGVSFRASIMCNEYANAMPAMSVPFMLAPPRAGMLVTVGSATATQGADITVSWAVFVNGAAADMSAVYTVTLMNRANPAIAFALSSGTSKTNDTVTVSLPKELDLAPSVANMYFFNVTVTTATTGATSAPSPTFAVSAPRAYITVTAPAAGAVFSAGGVVKVMWTGSNLPATAMFANVTLINAADQRVWGMRVNMADGATTGASFNLPADLRVAPGTASSFFVVVRSAEFTAIGGSSPMFTINPQATVSLTFTSIGGGANVDTTTGALLPVVVAESAMPTVTWSSINAAAGSIVDLWIKNANTQEARQVSGANGVVASAGAFTLSAGQLAGFTGARDPVAANAFYYETAPRTQPGLAAKSRMFSIFAVNNKTAITAAVRLTAPSTQLTRTAGQNIDVAWSSTLDATATVTGELVNSILGSAVTLFTSSASGSMTVQIPADLPLTAATMRSWFLRINASATVFAISPLITVLPATAAGVQFELTSPASGDAILVGAQPLTVAWRSFPASGYLVTLYLTNSGDSSSTLIAEDVAVASARFSWVVPTSVNTALAVRNLYSIKAVVRPASPDSTASPQSFASATFTVAAMDAQVRITSPAAGASYTMGSSISVTFSTVRARGPFRVSLVNSALAAVAGSWMVNASSWDAASWSAAGTASFVLRTDLPATPAAQAAWYIAVSAMDIPSAAARVGPISIAPLQNAYTVMAPAAGAVTTPSSPVRVAFALSAEAAATAGASTVSVFLMNRQSTMSVQLASNVSTASLQVVIPQDIPTGVDVRGTYFIRLAPSADGTGFLPCDSDVFTISAAPTAITVRAPMPGAVVTRGDKIVVAWTATSNVIGDAVISLFNTVTRTTIVLSKSPIVSGTAPAGTTIPDGLVFGTVSVTIPTTMSLPTTDEALTAFQIRVASAADEKVFSESARFAITVPRQSLRVLAPMNTGSLLTGMPVAVAWAAKAFSATATLSIWLRNTTASPAADSSYMWIASSVAVSTMVCPAGMPTDVSCGGINVTIPAVAASPNAWSIRVRSSDDATVWAESTAFVVRAPAPALAISVLAPSAALGTYMAGDVLPIAWTSNIASGTVRITVNCVSATAGEKTIATVAAAASISAGRVADYRLPFAAMTADSFSPCYVALTAGASIVKSAAFSIAMPVIEIKLSTPASLRNGASSGLVPILSGSDFSISWATTPAGVIDPSRLVVNLVRLGGPLGASQVYRIFPNNSMAGIPVNATIPPATFDAVSSTISTVMPGWLPLASYAVTIQGTVQGTTRVVKDQSGAFTVQPAGASLMVTSPTANAAFFVGSIVQVSYRMMGIATSNRVKISAVDAATGAMSTIVDATEATGVYRWAVPETFLISAASRQVNIKVELVSNSSIASSSGNFVVNPTAASVTVTSPAAMPNGMLPVWKAGDMARVNFTTRGLPANVTTVAIELWQDLYFAGGPKLLLTLTSSQSVRQMSFGFTIPANLPSDAPIFVRVVANLGGGKKLWGRSATNVNLVSAPLKGLNDFLNALCAGVTATSQPATFPSSWLPFCSRTCDACTASRGVWMPAVGASLDFDLPGWAGGQVDLASFKNALGAFKSTGNNLCWPADAVATSATGPSEYRITLRVPSIDATANTLSRGMVLQASPILTISGASDLLDTCTVRPVVRVSTTLGVDGTALTANETAALNDALKQQLASMLGPVGVTSTDIRITIGGSQLTTTTSAQMARLLAVTQGSTAAGFAVSTNDQGSADSAASTTSTSQVTATVSGSPVTTTGSSATAYTAESQLSADAASTSSQLAFTTSSSASATVPLGSDSETSLSESAFSSGYYAALVVSASTRDTGSAAYTAPASGSGSGSGTSSGSGSSDSSNLGPIIGGVVGGLVLVAIVVLVAVVVMRRGGNKPVSSTAPQMEATSQVNPLTAAAPKSLRTESLGMSDDSFKSNPMATKKSKVEMAPMARV